MTSQCWAWDRRFGSGHNPSSHLRLGLRGVAPVRKDAHKKRNHWFGVGTDASNNPFQTARTCSRATAARNSICPASDGFCRRLVACPRVEAFHLATRRIGGRFWLRTRSVIGPGIRGPILSFLSLDRARSSLPAAFPLIQNGVRAINGARRVQTVMIGARIVFRMGRLLDARRDRACDARPRKRATGRLESLQAGHNMLGGNRAAAACRNGLRRAQGWHEGKRRWPRKSSALRMRGISSASVV